MRAKHYGFNEGHSNEHCLESNTERRKDYSSHSPPPLPLGLAFLRSRPDISRSSVRGLQLQRKNGGLWTNYGIVDQSALRFAFRLKDYPHYCQHLASIPHFRDFPTSLIEYIEFGQQSREPPVGRFSQVGSLSQPPLPDPLTLPPPATPPSLIGQMKFVYYPAQTSLPQDHNMNLLISSSDPRPYNDNEYTAL